MIRRTFRIYCRAATPELLHRAIKTTWQGFAGGGAVSLGFSDRTGWMTLGAAVLGALGAGVTSFITNLMAAVDSHFAPKSDADTTSRLI